MARKTIRYKKKEWREWIYLTCDATEVEDYVNSLKAEGYQVEF